MESLWRIIYDDKSRSYDIIGKSSDDTLLTNNVSEMQRVNMKVHCHGGDPKYGEEELAETIKKMAAMATRP